MIPFIFLPGGLCGLVFLIIKYFYEKYNWKAGQSFCLDKRMLFSSGQE